jgi:vacuolar-type H+-ATPase subunit D/Vma8
MNGTARTVSRAARLEWLSKLDLARHAVELLRNKEEALRRERARLEGHAVRTEQNWHQQCELAGNELLRARAMGAGADLNRLLQQPRQDAAITIAWQAAMGVSYPGAVDTRPGPLPVLTTTASLIPATAGFGAALEAGAQFAAARTALDRLTTELVDTRHRRRAIEQRLQPRLENRIHQLDLVLDERDRDDALRTKLATRQDTRR